MCFSDEDQELWESDPQEYVRRATDPMTEYVSPQVVRSPIAPDTVACHP